jgi:hypothetical protein
MGSRSRIGRKKVKTQRGKSELDENLLARRTATLNNFREAVEADCQIITSIRAERAITAAQLEALRRLVRRTGLLLDAHDNMLAERSALLADHEQCCAGSAAAARLLNLMVANPNEPASAWRKFIEVESNRTLSSLTEP